VPRQQAVSGRTAYLLPGFCALTQAISVPANGAGNVVQLAGAETPRPGLARPGTALLTDPVELLRFIDELAS